MSSKKTELSVSHTAGGFICAISVALGLSAGVGSAAVLVGNDLTTAPAAPGGGAAGGDTGNVFIVDGWHNPGITPNFTIPAGGGFLTQATILNDDDETPESVDILVLRPAGGNNFSVIHRVTLSDDSPAFTTGSTSYPLANLAVSGGDVMAHWGLGNQPIPLDCCGSGPGDVQITNLTSSNFDVGNTVTFAPFPQKRSYFWNVSMDPIPEPSTAVLLGLAGLGLVSRRRRP
ncbi:MAG: PEP-CTERM sorting domain-containing protein [Verrucomicrobiales bacterium]